MNASHLIPRAINKLDHSWRSAAAESIWRLRSVLHRPSAEEQAAIKRLQEEFRKISAQKTDSLDFWSDMRKELGENISAGKLSDFLDWPVIAKTMFYQPPRAELEYMRTRPDWQKWRTAIASANIGNPRPYPFALGVNGNSLHLAYSLERFLEISGKKLSDMKTIVEFGGGYGELCRLAYKMGFGGQYIIFDLPEFSALQEYYLRAVDVGLHISTKPRTWQKASVILLSRMEGVESQFQTAAQPDLLIALWSISESPVALRDEFFSVVRPASYCIGYQGKFDIEKIDNTAYFNGLQSRFPAVNWHIQPIEHLKKGHHFYLFGSEKQSA